jgi:outer membrane protein W
VRKLSILLVIAICVFAFGQEKEKNDETRNSVALGSRAMVFEFNGLSNLGAGSYNGGIAGKYFFQHNMAVRGGIRFELYSETTPANAPAGFNGKDREYSTTNFGLFGMLEYHFAPKSYISPYFGGGLGYYMLSGEEKNADIYFPGSDSYREVTELSGRYTFEIAGLIGAEIFIVKEISLSVEYLVYLNLTSLGEEKTKYQITSGQPTLPDGDTTDLGSATIFDTASGGQIILSIYF